MITLLALACGGGTPPTAVAPEDDAPVEVRMTLDGTPHGGHGTVVVQAWYDKDGELTLSQPTADGLTFAPDGPPRTEHIGDRDAVTQRYVFRGKAGSYGIRIVDVVEGRSQALGMGA